MDIREVKDLIQDILNSDISEFELEHTGTRLRLRRGFSNDGSYPVVAAPSPAVPLPPKAASPREAPQPAARPADEDADADLHLITSPIVGTFYRAPSPGTEPYVKVGTVVEEGAILCIIEAMKLMNEIPSDIAGEIIRIYVENGTPVEFGQKLFGLRARR
jgi:acetyl-CoA carboxylase biotin carboxyl carrier protein